MNKLISHIALLTLLYAHHYAKILVLLLRPLIAHRNYFLRLESLIAERPRKNRKSSMQLARSPLTPRMITLFCERRLASVLPSDVTSALQGYLVALLARRE